MRRLARPFWVILALLFLLEAWLWDHLQPVVARIVGIIPWGRIKPALVALIVIMLLGALGGDLFSPGHWHKDFKIGLGLDLSSGTQVTMKATTPTGGIPSSAEMNRS